ncbi:uncharacterized protein LOC123317626 [Coccinella septempunctata]|uniref:uncharacterized protein LOC123317626 n=1 Tax=Coccinella septempunctata TaxID=41139 RepID=UPI001D08B382|nr:uncharacterized protein LOC123317626 [Coccinella septempunctata]
MVHLAVKYKSLSIRRSEIRIDVWFLHRCMFNGVTPTFAVVRASKNVPISDRLYLEHKILRRNIRKHYRRLQEIDCNMKITYDLMREEMDFEEIQDILRRVSICVEYRREMKFSKVSRKLNNLISRKNFKTNNANRRPSQNFSDFKFHERIKNMTQVRFDEDELNLLKLGLKFSFERTNAPPQRRLQLKEFSVELDVILENICKDDQHRNDVRNELLKHIQPLPARPAKIHNNTPHSSGTRRPFPSVLKSVKEKIETHNLIITKADKGNCLVILDKHVYIEKTENFLDSENFKTLEHSPQPTLMKKFKTYLKACDEFLSEFNAPKNLIPSNPSVPKLYGLPKIHKLNVPIRPVVSFVNTPVYTLSKFMLSVLKRLCSFEPEFTVKNSLCLVEKLRDLRPGTDCLMISFDVTNLFTCTPKDESVKIVNQFLISQQIPEQTRIDVITLLNFCLSQDYFLFNKKFFQQLDGLGMGNPLSPFIADAFMDFVEKIILTRFSHVILHWSRYVDDVFVLIRESLMSPTELLHEINKIHPNIKFTLEVETQGSIDFLDLTISRSEESFSYKIFHKPTQTDVLIHADSNHPRSHKMAAFHSFANRLLSVPMTEFDYEAELNIIQQLAQNNGYNPSIITSLIEKIKRRNLTLKYPQKQLTLWAST